MSSPTELSTLFRLASSPPSVAANLESSSTFSEMVFPSDAMRADSPDSKITEFPFTSALSEASSCQDEVNSTYPVNTKAINQRPGTTYWDSVKLRLLSVTANCSTNVTNVTNDSFTAEVADSSSLDEVLQITSDLKRNIQIFYSHEYLNIISTLIPVFRDILVNPKSANAAGGKVCGIDNIHSIGGNKKKSSKEDLSLLTTIMPTCSSFIPKSESNSANIIAVEVTENKSSEIMMIPTTTTLATETTTNKTVKDVAPKSLTMMTGSAIVSSSPRYTPPNPSPTSIQHKLRNAIIDLISRFPHNEIFRPYASVVSSIMMNVLLEDYEGNASLASNVLFQLQKHYQIPGLFHTNSKTTIVTASHSQIKGEETRQLRLLQTFFDFICECFRGLVKQGGTSMMKNFVFMQAIDLDEKSSFKGSYSSPTSISIASPESTTFMPTFSLKSIQSLRVLSECLSVVMLMFQLYPKYLKTFIPIMIPLMMDALKLTPPPPSINPNEGVIPTGSLTGATSSSSPSELLSLKVGTPSTSPKKSKAVSSIENDVEPHTKEITSISKQEGGFQEHCAIKPAKSQFDTYLRLYHIRYRELIVAQVKTLSFLTYVIHGFSDLMRPYEEDLAANVVSLMKICPDDAIGTRKDLLVATRHILGTDFRRGFIRQVDTMLDERVLMGSLSLSMDQLSVRPLAYSTLADLIHNSKTRLSPAQMSRAIRIFSRVLHDVSIEMPMSMQITAVRLLLHLVDQIFNNSDTDPQVGRDMLFRILSTLIQKLATVNAIISVLNGAIEKEILDQNLYGADLHVCDSAYNTSNYDCVDCKSSSTPTAMHKDIQSLLRPIFQGLKTVIWCIKSYSSHREKEGQRALAAGEEIVPLPAFVTTKENDEVNSAMLHMTHGELDLIDQYIKFGFPCLSAFRWSVESENLSFKHSEPPQRHREMIEAFASSFTVLESFHFRAKLSENSSFIMEQIDRDGEIIAFFKHLILASGKTISYDCCEIMIVYLVENIAECGTLHSSDQALLRKKSNGFYKQPPMFSTRSQHQFKLLMIIFSSFSEYPKNENALLPHLYALLHECIRRSMEGPLMGQSPYLRILQSLFRTICGGKFEASYKEILPFIPTMLNGFHRIYSVTEDKPLRFMIIEILLTIPSRLSVLLPHLPLLVKIIIPALQSQHGDLINLALRTLEFWVDNLHPDYLFFILSQQKDTLCELMVSLTDHLQPVPYPHGLLCLRLLGKLGGKNRLFLQEIMTQEPQKRSKMSKAGLTMLFEWQYTKLERLNSEKATSSNCFPLQLPLERALDVLRLVANSPQISRNATFEANLSRLPLECPDEYFSQLFAQNSECIDLDSFSSDLMKKIITEQSRSAFVVIRASLASLLDLSGEEGYKILTPRCFDPKFDETIHALSDGTDLEELNESSKEHLSLCNKSLKIICDSLFAATVIEELKDEAMVLLKGLGSHILFVTASHRNSISRIDSDGVAVDSLHQVGFEAQNHLSGGKIQPLKPFGTFRLLGPLSDRLDFFLFNESLVDAFSESSVDAFSAAFELMNHIIGTFHEIEVIINKDESPHREPDGPDLLHGVSAPVDFLLENLLSQMCRSCYTKAWNFRLGIMKGLLELLNMMGMSWCKQYEVEILHLVMFLVKDAPCEITHAVKESMRFFLSITWFFFGGPLIWKKSHPTIYDSLYSRHLDRKKTLSEKEEFSLPTVNLASLTLIVSEIGSTKHIVRFAVRHFLRLITHDSSSIESVLVDHVASLKRLLFPRLLRVSPLPEQVAIVESLAFIIDRASHLFPISDQTVLAFTAELLKMVSIADGDITDSNFSSVVLIDKNGFAVNCDSSKICMHTKHVSSLFLRKSFTLKGDAFGGCIVVPEEFPLGIQLRVASICLFRSIVRAFPNEFFDAQPKSQLGNIKPHIVSLFFRSLASEPLELVSTSESALHDVLLLGVSEKDDDTDETLSRSSHRLQKELIQTCIRPILVNLRDHTKLTIPLLRGISRLLSLLSSWFNKALGDKLLEHLQKFTEAEKIIGSKLWNPGEEVQIAVAVMDLFALLPSSQKFVEALVKITIRLEAVLPKYVKCQPVSPFREPLARYLDLHFKSATGFFLERHRLSNPMYSGLFLDLLQRKSTASIQRYLAEKECTVMLLNVCFERPLAIIRSEKNAPSSAIKMSSAQLFKYGVHPWNSPSAQRKREIGRKIIEIKQAQLELKIQEESESLRASKSKPDDASMKQTAKQAHQNARLAVDRAKKELEHARSAYKQELSQFHFQCISDKDNQTQRPMTTASLELQHQGFKIIETLIKCNPNYFSEQNDVVGAVRWLWRSRGRHFRLMHEEQLQPRYHSESFMLAKFLVTYSKSNSADIDVLFDLIRIFLQPSSIDFSFVKRFLHQIVIELSVEERSQIMERYLTLLSSEGSEETKVLSARMLVSPMFKKSLTRQGPNSAGTMSIVSDSSIKNFMTFILHGSPFGSKLTCELLLILNFLLEHMFHEISYVRRDLIKYIWNVLKNDDASTKYYGYLALSRFVSVFDTPPKVILQVYKSLMRSYNMNEKKIVCASLDILIPALSKRLTTSELEIVIQFTAKVFREEGNNLQQLVHLFEIITRHPQFYVCYSFDLIPQMIHSLSALDFSQNPSSEHKELSMAVARLIFDWIKRPQRSQKTISLSAIGEVQNIAETVSTVKNHDQSIFNTLANFVVKLALMNAEGKIDDSHRRISTHTKSFLCDIVSLFPNCDVSPEHFDRTFSVSSVKAERERSLPPMPQEPERELITSSETTTSFDGKLLIINESDINITTLLVTSLEILNTFQCYDPENKLLHKSLQKMLTKCFSHLVSVNDKTLRQLLKTLVVNVLMSGHASTETVSTIVVLLENGIMGMTGSGTLGEETKVSHGIAYLAIEVIEEICFTDHDFIEPFIGALTIFAKEQAKEHIQETIGKSRSVSSKTTGTGNTLAAIPTLGVFELACGVGLKTSMGSKDLLSSSADKVIYKAEVESLNASQKFLVKCLRLIGSSSSLFRFSNNRKSFIEVLSLLLHSSNTLQILMASVSIIGKWLSTKDPKIPLTRGELVELLLGITHIDFNKLPEVASHALIDMVCCIVLSSLGYEPIINHEYPFGCKKSCPLDRPLINIHNSRDKNSLITEETLRKLVAMGLMSANSNIRLIYVIIFTVQKKDCNLVQKRLSDLAIQFGLRTGDTIDVAGIPDRCPLDIIRQVLDSDLECIGNRLCTVLLVDLLLVSGCHVGGVCLASTNPRKQTVLNNVDIRESCMRGYLRLNTDHERATDLSCIVDDDYLSFISHILSERNEKLCGRGRCISAVRILLHGDVDTSQTILECCFQAVWDQLLNSQEKADLILTLEKFLSRPYYSQFLHTSQCDPVNTIQSSLRVLGRLQPAPPIDSFLAVSLASDYNAHHEVLTLLERQYMALTRNEDDVDLARPHLVHAIKQCFVLLGDSDISLSISSAMCNIPGTKLALSLDMYGFVNKSADAYVSLIDRADRANIDLIPSEFESKLWEERWLNAQRELSQWSLIDEIVTSSGNYNLMIECAWKTKNWDKVKSLCGMPSIIAAMEEGDPLAKMTEFFLSIHEGKLSELENLHAQTAQLCLYKWQLLPPVGSGSNAHKALLQQFHRLVELRESSQIIAETASHSSRRTIPDLKNLLSSWRHRTPNLFESISVWDDLYSWRFYIFDAIASSFSWSEPGTLATLHDRPFAAISLGRAARKQNIKEVAMYLLSHLTDCAMDVDDAFLKLREQIVAYQYESEDMLKGGLNLVNSTNLTFFDARQKAEIFRLKSYFFNALNDKPKAHQAYCHAVQISPSYARAWIDWGHLCASLAANNRKSADHKDASKRISQYLAQAMGCYLEAVRCDACEHSRENIPHCLSMLSEDGSQYGSICKTLEARGTLLPAWVWLPWIPQLLTSLCRVEASAMKALLMVIVKDHPQAVYHSLRAFFLERRAIERSNVQDSTSKHEDDAQSHAEVLMSNLRKSHPVLWSRLEAILDDLIIRFRPSHEAELLATIKALLEKAASKIDEKNESILEENNCTMLESLSSNLSKIALKFFNNEKPDITKTRKTVLFEQKWKSSFERDFLENTSKSSGGNPGVASIDDLVMKLKKWKIRLEHQVSLAPNTCNLQEASPALSWYSGQSPDLWAGSCESCSLTLSNAQHDYHLILDNALYEASRSSTLAAAKMSSNAVLLAAKYEGLGGHEGGGSSIVEIPGQYAPTSSSVLDSRPFPELHAKLIHFDQTLEVINSTTKQDQNVRQITMVGSDGKHYKFLLQLAISYWTRTDERSAQLLYVMGKILRKDVQACRRCLFVRPNVVIPVAQRMRMTANEASYHSLDTIFRHMKGSDVNKLVSHFEEEVVSRSRDFVNANIKDDNSDAVKAVKLEVYRSICQNFVQSNIVTEYMMETIPSMDQLFQFRKIFVSQMAANSLLQYIFAVIERTPSRFVFCNRSGLILTHDFRFQYNQGLLEERTVPFRLTRNLVDFIGPFLLEGIFVPTFVSISSAMNAKRRTLESVLHLLLRDDIISWYISKSQARNDQKTQELEHQLADRVWKNVRFVQHRLQECSARQVENATEEVISSDTERIDNRVRNLVNIATKEQNLCLMSPNYHAWL